MSLAGLRLRLWLYRLTLGTQHPGEGSPEAAMAEWVQERVDGRIEPEEPEGDLIPMVLHTAPTTGCPDDHQQRVWCPTDPKDAHDDCQRLGDLLVTGEA